MLIGSVVGRVWVDRQVEALHGLPLVLVERRDTNAQVVAVDLLDAAVGQLVLVATDEAAQHVAGNAGLDAAVVAFVTGVGED